jgi:hypothetical protein
MNIARTRRATPSNRGLSLFNNEGHERPEDALIAMSGMIELHHDEYSDDATLDEIEVLGARATPEVLAELSAYGFTDVAPSERGFVAKRGH